MSLAIGDRARVTAEDGLNLRRAPRLDPQNIVDAMPHGAEVQILDGPAESDGITWWEVRFGREVGWAAATFLARVRTGPGVVPCDKIERLRVGAVHVWQLPGQTAFFYEAGLAVDADGAPTAYHPPPDSDRGLDALANAGSPGHWFGIVTDTGEPDGNPIVQGAADPAPGFYVSATSLQDRARSRHDPRRYVDATRIPYIVLPPVVRDRFQVKLGDFAMVCRRGNRQLSGAIFADIGPASHLGEGSVALAEALGIPASPRTGGTDGGVIYVVFPGSGDGRPRPLEEIAAEAQQRFAAMGGLAQLDACFPPEG